MMNLHFPEKNFTWRGDGKTVQDLHCFRQGPQTIAKFKFSPEELEKLNANNGEFWYMVWTGGQRLMPFNIVMDSPFAKFQSHDAYSVIKYVNCTQVTTKDQTMLLYNAQDADAPKQMRCRGDLWLRDVSFAPAYFPDFEKARANYLLAPLAEEVKNYFSMKYPPEFFEGDGPLYLHDLKKEELHAVVLQNAPETKLPVKEPLMDHPGAAPMETFEAPNIPQQPPIKGEWRNLKDEQREDEADAAQAPGDDIKPGDLQRAYDALDDADKQQLNDALTGGEESKAMPAERGPFDDMREAMREKSDRAKNQLALDEFVDGLKDQHYKAMQVIDRVENEIRNFKFESKGSIARFYDKFLGAKGDLKLAFAQLNNITSFNLKQQAGDRIRDMKRLAEKLHDAAVLKFQ